MTGGPSAPQGPRVNRILGSLKDALVAASRDDTIQPVQQVKADASAAASSSAAVDAKAPGADKNEAEKASGARQAGSGISAADAAREARGAASPDRHVELDAPPTTRVLRVGASAKAPSGGESDRTQRVRGKANVMRGEFHQDPVVGWLVVVGGLGLGSYRPVFEGNNAIGRASTQRIPIDFGDDAISSEEQAFIRYDSTNRSFLFVPNLSKTNIVSINDKRPTGAVELNHMDVITMGRTQLVFVPFCGSEFDWSELADAKG